MTPERLSKHCWPEWAKHWGGGWAAAWPTWTKDTAGRKKFRTDVVAQLAKVGLPKPMAPDADNDRARERDAAWLDQRLAEAPAPDGGYQVRRLREVSPATTWGDSLPAMP